MTGRERAADGLRRAWPAYDIGFAAGQWHAFRVDAPHPALALITADSPEGLDARIQAAEIARCGGWRRWLRQQRGQRGKHRVPWHRT